MDHNIRLDDLRIAYHVAREGSLSRAGEALGINHSTALRAVNRLEDTLGLRLFIRHQRGYQLTDSGRIMVEKMRPITGDIQRLLNTLTTVEAAPSGTLRISTVTDFSPYFAPILHAFRQEYPQVRVQIMATDDVLSLADGDVHVAIRIGSEPQEPDLIARSLMNVSLNFYASDLYVKQYGLPQTLDEVNQHFWVLPSGDKTRIPIVRDMIDRIKPEQLAFQSNSFSDIESAVRAGMGIGPLSLVNQRFGIESDLKKVELAIDTEPSKMWFVYHKDMRQSVRLKALLDFLQRNISSE
jgi:DNA-binding transcriptional LysR family regulator